MQMKWTANLLQGILKNLYKIWLTYQEYFSIVCYKIIFSTLYSCIREGYDDLEYKKNGWDKVDSNDKNLYFIMSKITQFIEK